MEGNTEMTPEMLIKMLDTQEKILESIARIETRLDAIDKEMADGKDRFKEIDEHFKSCPVNDTAFRYGFDLLVRHTATLQEMIKEHNDKQKRKDTIKDDITKNIIDLAFKVGIAAFAVIFAASKIFHF